MKRLLASVLTISVVGLAAGMGSASALPSAPVGCRIAGSVSFSPGLTNTTQTTVSNVYNKVRFKACSPGVSKARIHGALSGPASCNAGTATGTLTFIWNSGPKSKVSITYTNGTLTGQVMSGQFSGGIVHGSVSLKATAGNCAIGGVTSAKVKGAISL